MGKMGRKVNASQDYCWAKQTVNRKHIYEAVVAYLPQHLLATDGATVMEEASKAFGEIFGMKADIDEINEQLTIRTDYESDAYMKLIERVSDLSEKFYAIEEVNYEAEVEKY
jgi:ATP-binding cassette subfamily F protein 3